MCPLMLLTIGVFLIAVSAQTVAGPFSPFFFFFNDTATTEIYTPSLHDALPILLEVLAASYAEHGFPEEWRHHHQGGLTGRSEEHTSELQSRFELVCRLLLE